MRLLIHDYPGHPFQVQLGRELAYRGHQVLHFYAGYNVTPRGELARKVSDSDSFQIAPIYIRKPLEKYSFLKRWVQEREYGKLLVKEIQAFQPDVLISANTPLDAQAMVQKAASRTGVGFIFWLQDLIGLAAQRLLRQKFSFFGGLVGRYYSLLERNLLQKSDHIVLISDGFQPLMNQWEIDAEKASVIPNWAPLESVPVYPKQNPWARQYGLSEKFCFMYTGTLGMKHNPDVLLQLAFRYQDQNDVLVVVISEGPGADWLAEKKSERQLENLILLPYQPFEQLPQVMAAADVLVALLEPDAGVFSVPSKVLTYLCAQRPLLLAVPLENFAAKIVSENQAGIVVAPDDVEAFLDGSERLLQKSALRDRFAHNARHYAEEQFDIKKIANQFEEIINSLV